MRPCDRCQGTGKLPDRLRSSAQNSRYWATLTEMRTRINQIIEAVSGETGYTPLEVKRLIAQDMLPEQVAILFSKSEDTAHDVIKDICGVPSSTRLGTKEFMNFEDRMIQACVEIEGIVSAFERRAG